MKKILFLSELLLIGAITQASEKKINTQKEKPNILCITCEDISPYLGCYGDPVAISPNIDNFSRGGIIYKGMFTTIGVSAPSRASLITGMYPTAIGANNMRTAQNKSKPDGITPYDVVLPEGVKCFTEFLRAEGYYCTNNLKTDYQFESPLTAWDECSSSAHWKNKPANRPFFSIFNLTVTHEFEIMKRAGLPLLVNPEDIAVPDYFPDNPITRRDMAIMYSNIAEMDRQFQLIIDELKAEGELENTIIIFYSDNGGPLPRQKRELYESGANVPFIVRFPDKKDAGTTDNKLHMFADIPATILSIAGIRPPAYMQGVPFLGQYKGKDRKYVYGARDRLDTFYEKQVAVRDHRYRYIRNYKPEQPCYLPIISRSSMPIIKEMVRLHEAGQLSPDAEKWFVKPRPVEELYDVLNDPFELNNLAENTTYKAVISRLRKEQDRWLKEENPLWSYTEPELIELFWPGRRQPVTSQPEIDVTNNVVKIACATKGASIAYQINGKGYADGHWFLYTKPFTINPGDSVTAVAVRAGYAQSVQVGISYASGVNSGEDIRVSANKLLSEWVDSLLTYQIKHTNPSLNGGLLCPACSRVHGRCGDAVFPIMYMASHTQDKKYIEAAKQLMKWMDNVRIHDGSWMNDVHVSDWNGTTVFMAISLAETLKHYGNLLDDSTRGEWNKQLLEAGEFICKNDFIYSRKRKNWRNMNVNYAASAVYALFLIGQEFNRQDFISKSTEIAHDLEASFTENEHFLYGEGPEIKKKTKNGCFPVDLLYNVEESLPNLALYAIQSKNTTLLDLVSASVLTHLEFMLPDGAWDNSWGTRSFKWTYWGGRTSDGFMAGFYALADENPVLFEAIVRNLHLLKQSTYRGILQGGAHYAGCKQESCIHHTFGHAKTLASLLSNEDLSRKAFKSQLLPREQEYGVKFFKDIRTWLVSVGDWRATVTGYDAEYKVKGTHPMGGVLSLLWHRTTGPLFAAGMNSYSLIEAPNMQADNQKYKMPATPRIEYIQNDTLYSNMDDLDTQINCSETEKGYIFHVQTYLTDKNQRLSRFGNQKIDVKYVFTKENVRVQCHLPAKIKHEPVFLVLPFIADVDEMETLISPDQLQIQKDNATIVVKTNMPLDISPTNNGRILNMVPGFAFIPVKCSADKNGYIEAVISIR